MVQRCRNNHPGQRCTFQAIYGQNPHADTIFQIQEHKLRLWATKTKRKVIGGHKTQLCRAPCHIARTMARLKRQPASKIPNEVSNTRTTLHRAAQDTLSSNNEATPALLLVRCLSMEPNNRSRLYTTHVLTLCFTQHCQPHERTRWAITTIKHDHETSNAASAGR